MVDSSKPHIALLFVFRAFYALGFFELFDLLHHLRPINLLVFIVLVNCIIYGLIHRPWRHKIAPDIKRPLIVFGLIEAGLSVLWIYAIYLAGPMRALLVTEFPFALSAISGICFASSDRQNQSTLFIMSTLVLLIFDGELFGSALALISTLIQQKMVNYRRQLEPKVGGPKRTKVLIKMVHGVAMIPIFLLSLLFGRSDEGNFTHPVVYLIPALFSAILVESANYYICMLTSLKLGPERQSTVRYKASLLFAFLWSYYWTHPFTHAVSGIYGRQALPRQEHAINVITVLVSAGFYLAASFGASSTGATSTRGALIGYSAAGKPLYSLRDSMNRLNTNANLIKTFLVEVLSKPDSRSIFYFLCINLAFAFVELFCGIWNNSLGLISDSFHMFFDCSALIMGLVASVVAKWKPNKKFSYGFGRVEVLSGYVNSLFLMVIGCMLVKEAVYRLVAPPEVHTHHLLSVSIIGLIVNVIGLASFSHAHSHGGEPCQSSSTSSDGNDDHGHSHGHSHGDQHHQHSHGHSHGPNENMRGVYLHIMADLLGSVGVIVSSLLVQRYSWYRADPFCTLIIAIMILLSVFPLFKSSAETLLLRAPPTHQKAFHEALYKTMQLKDVVSYRDQRIWKFSSNVVCASLVVQLAPGGNEQNTISQISAFFKEAKVQEITVQCEKEEFVELLEHLDQNDTNFDYNTDVYHPERQSEDAFI